MPHEESDSATAIEPAIGGYTWSLQGEHPTDGVRIDDVVVMSTIFPDERFVGGTVDEDTLDGFAKTFELGASKGKRPRVLLNHNQHEQEADVIGFLVGMRRVGRWLVVDMEISNPSAIGKMARGELPSLSVEFVFETRFIWALSFISGAEGHFDEELPDFALEDAEGLGDLKKLSGKDLKSIAAPPVKFSLTNAQKLAEAMNDAEIDAQFNSLRTDVSELAARQSNIDAIQQRQQEQLTALTLTNQSKEPAVTEPEKTEETTEQAKTDATEVHRLSAEVAVLKTELWTDREVQKLRDGGCVLTVDQIKEQFAECKTDEGRRERAKFLAASPPAPTESLEADPENPATTADAYRAEYQARLAAGENLFGTEEEYVAISLKRGVPTG